MTNQNKKNYLLISLVSIVLGSLFIIGSLSFTLSFYSISSLAMSLGVVQEIWLARMIGVIIDLLMMASMGAHLYHSFEGHFADRPDKGDYLGIAQHFVSTNLTAISMYGMAGVSIWFNAIHSGKYDVPSVVMSSIPAVSMLVTTEMVAAIIRTWVRNGDLATGIDSLRATVSELLGTKQELVYEISKLKEEVKEETLTLTNLQSQQSQYTISLSMCSELEEKVLALREEADRLASENRQVKSESKQVSELTELLKDQLFCAVSTNVLGATQAEAATIIGKSTKTVQSYNKEGVELLNGTMAKFKQVVEVVQARKK